MLRRILASSALLLAPVLLPAQSPLVGKWKIEIVAGMRIENEERVLNKANATLTITEQGDSLIATLDVEPNANVPARPQARFGGLKPAAGADAVLTQKS